MAALGGGDQPGSLGLPALPGFHRLAEPVALAIHLENVVVVAGPAQERRGHPLPLEDLPHSLNGRSLVTRMLARSSRSANTRNSNSTPPRLIVTYPSSSQISGWARSSWPRNRSRVYRSCSSSSRLTS